MATKRDAAPPLGGQIIQRINVSDIEPDPDQPRKHFDIADIEATLRAEDGIAVDGHDVTHPLQLIERAWGGPPGPPYRIKDGERRWRAAKNVGLLSVPAYFVPAADRAAILEDQLRAGITVQSFRPLEIADAIAHRMAMSKRKPPSAEDLAARVGLSSARQVNRYRQLSTLAPAVRDALERGEIEMSIALEIATIADPVQQAEALPMVTGASLRTARADIRDHYHLQLVDCGFDPADAALPGGSCEACPKNTAIQRGLFADGEGDGRCTDRACFAAKRDWTWIALKNAALSRGAELVEGEAAKKLILPWGGSRDDLIVLGGQCGPDYDSAKAEKREQRTWRDVLGDIQPSILVRNDRGRVHELVTLAEARAAAEKAGHMEIVEWLVEDIEEQRRATASAEPSTPARTDEARRREIAAEREAEEALWTRLRGAAAAAPLDAKLLRLLCGLAIRGAGSDICEAICDSRGVDAGPDAADSLLARVATLLEPDIGALQALLLELLARCEDGVAFACRFFGIGAGVHAGAEPPIVQTGICRVCGCTDEHACTQVRPSDAALIAQGCAWVDPAETLCTVCAETRDQIIDLLEAGSNDREGILDQLGDEERTEAAIADLIRTGELAEKDGILLLPVPALCELCGLRAADPATHCEDCEKLKTHILQLCAEKPRQGPQIKAASRDWHKDRVHAAIKHLTAAGKLDKDSSGFSTVRT